MFTVEAAQVSDPTDAAEPSSTDRKSTRLNSSHGYISYAVFCLKKKNIFTNYWSLDLKSGTPPQLINHGFKSKDCWFVMQVGRQAQIAKLVAMRGHPEWKDAPHC